MQISIDAHAPIAPDPEKRVAAAVSPAAGVERLPLPWGGGWGEG